MTLIIGITGQARAGKDTAASYLRHEYGFHNLAFASPIKTMAAALANEPVANFVQDELKEGPVLWLGMTRRRIMQLVGTESTHPIFGRDIWIRHLMNRVDQHYVGQRVTVSDVRHDLEARAILNKGGYILRLHRGVAGLRGEAAAHSSEAGVDPDLVDFDVINDGTLGELHHELKKIADFVLFHGART